MYNAPDFIKVDMNVSESFATYNCEAVYDASTYYFWNTPECRDYEETQDHVLSGSRGGTYECYIVPNVL